MSISPISESSIKERTTFKNKTKKPALNERQNKYLNEIKNDDKIKEYFKKNNQSIFSDFICL